MKPIRGSTDREIVPRDHAHEPIDERALVQSAARRAFRKGRPRNPTALYFKLQGTVAAEYEQRLRTPSLRDAAILELVRVVGPEILRAPLRGYPEREPLATHEEVQARLRLREIVWKRLVDAYRIARDEGHEEQPHAVAFLEGLGRALGGKRRGRRAQVGEPADLRLFYYGTLYRLKFVRTLVRNRCGCTPQEKIVAAAQASGFRIEDLREYLLDTHGELKRPITCEEQARVWTAAAFKIKQHTVSNFLASRKSP